MQRESGHESGKERLLRVLEGSAHSKAAHGFEWVMVALIALNTIAIIIETIPAIGIQFSREFKILEAVSIVVFAVEYFLRLWVSDINPSFGLGPRGRLRFLVSPAGVIDLLSFLPSLLPFTGLDLRFLRTLRLMRLLRLLKLGRYIRAVGLITAVARAKGPELAVSGLVALLVLLIASCLMYYIEYPAQPDKFRSIPETMWWAMATLTTVGYGDIYPVTPLGKVLGSITAIVGIGLFALPAGIIASGFADALKMRSEHKEKQCPHCGHLIVETGK